MKTFNITITAKFDGDAEMTLEEVKRLIEDGNIAGKGGEPSCGCSFSFTSEGDYDEDTEG
jgi:hypothetical protein